MRSCEVSELAHSGPGKCPEVASYGFLWFLQVALLKDVLDTWKSEVEKKPPQMTVEEAYGNLGLQGTAHDEAVIRKAYYKLAQQFHPDKNPEGRVSFPGFWVQNFQEGVFQERFEQVNQAYEFLCSRTSWNADGPNPNNIVLLLKTQSILFHRHSEGVETPLALFHRG